MSRILLGKGSEKGGRGGEGRYTSLQKPARFPFHGRRAGTRTGTDDQDTRYKIRGGAHGDGKLRFFSFFFFWRGWSRNSVRHDPRYQDIFLP